MAIQNKFCYMYANGQNQFLHIYIYLELSPLKQTLDSLLSPLRIDFWAVALAILLQRTRTWATHGILPLRVSGGYLGPGKLPGGPGAPPRSAGCPSGVRTQYWCLMFGLCLFWAERFEKICNETTTNPTQCFYHIYTANIWTNKSDRDKTGKSLNSLHLNTGQHRRISSIL